ncbi:AtpZ/AtpI family protein [bacterium]|nr:MAG: AtpZ/AtpI family protein [bacterium]
MPEKNKKPNKGISAYAHLLSLGIEMAVSMIVPVLCGWYLQTAYEINPWGILGGALFGFVSSFWIVYKRVLLNK